MVVLVDVDAFPSIGHDSLVIRGAVSLKQYQD